VRTDEVLGDLSQYPNGVRQVSALPYEMQQRFHKPPWGMPNTFEERGLLWCGHPQSCSNKDSNEVEYCMECSR
jgi:hypothetical protein